MSCICPENTNDIPDEKKMMVIPPGVMLPNGKVRFSAIAVFHADCPLHGYHVISETELEVIDES